MAREPWESDPNAWRPHRPLHPVVLDVLYRRLETEGYALRVGDAFAELTETIEAFSEVARPLFDRLEVEELLEEVQDASDPSHQQESDV